MALTCAAAACGGDDSEAGTAGSDGDGAVTANGGEGTGGEVTIVQFGEPTGLDPIGMPGYASADGPLAFSIYDTLMRWDEDTNTVVPQLAESLETADHTTWTLTLREAVTFTDGTPLDAEAVQFNLERMRDTPTALSVGQASLIASTRVVSPTVLEFTLVAPLPHFDINLTKGLGYIASPTAIQELGEDYGANPVGAGPFMVGEWKRGDHLTLVRNPNYWNAPLPKLDAITFRAIPDNAQRVNVLSTGEAQITYATDATSVDQLVDAGLEYTTLTLNGGEGLLFNTKKPPFDDPELRKAIAYAINPEDFNNAVYDGHATVGGFLFSHDSPWFDPSAKPPAYDAERATAIFEAYEAENGSPLKFTYNSFQSASSQAVGQYLQAALGQFGVEVTVDVADAATAATKVYTGEFHVSNWGLTIGGEPEPDLSQFFLGGLPGNLSGIADPRLDAALEVAGSSTDEKERKAAYADVQHAYYDVLPFLLLNQPGEGLLHAKDVIGVRLTSNGTLMTDQLARS
jgi:peptide/nickel transport system substrate-binding protein